MIRDMRWLVLIVPIALTGCVERYISIRSQPAGATVYVDGERVGETPVEVKYHWYGTRTVTLEKAGFTSATRQVELDMPWWQIFPLDFVTDVLIPFTITDRTELSFLLEEGKQERIDVEGVKKRADELRQKARE